MPKFKDFVICKSMKFILKKNSENRNVFTVPVIAHYCAIFDSDDTLNQFSCFKIVYL